MHIAQCPLSFEQLRSDFIEILGIGGGGRVTSQILHGETEAAQASVQKPSLANSLPIEWLHT